MSDSQDFFRVPAVVKMRQQPTGHKTLRPFVLSSVRSEIEMHLHSSSLDKNDKLLTEKMFELVLGLDLRLQRIEEQLDAVLNQALEQYPRWFSVALDLGAEGFYVKKSDWPFKAQPDASLNIEFLVPVVPEWPFQAILSTRPSKNSEYWHFGFEEIHYDDREMIHRYLRIRERELLRARQKSI